MEEEINLWMAQNRENAEKVGLKIMIENVNADSMCVMVVGYMMMVGILYDGSFVAISLEDEADDTFMAALQALNNKLRIGPTCLSNVLDKILQVFSRLTEKRIEESAEDFTVLRMVDRRSIVSGIAEVDSYVYRSAKDFTLDSETVLGKVERSSVVSGILPWCSVKLIRGLEVVEVRMEIKKIMAADNVAAALQFSLDDPLVFHLSFGSNTWVRKEDADEEFFRSAKVYVKESPVQIQKLKDAMERALNGMDERFKNAIKKSWYRRMRPYGPYVLLPHYIEGFLEQCYIRPDGGLAVRQKVALSCNIFVTLVIIVGCWLKTLRAFCAICKRRLPSFSRLWCCDAES